MGLPDPDDVAAYDELLPRIMVGAPEVLEGRIVLHDYDPAWPARYEREAARIAGALGARAIRLEHVGSTSVPGLAAKPIIDIVLEVEDSAHEAAYVPDLEAAGHVLTVREPEWFEHRLLKPPGGGVHLHVFSAGCPETERMVRFRDHLRRDRADRERYGAAKRELAARPWKYMQQYADAKSEIVGVIMARAAPGETCSSLVRAQPPTGPVSSRASRS